MRRDTGKPELAPIDLAAVARCAVFAFPTIYEGLGLPILEAMHCGAPVVAGNNSSQVEVVDDAGLLADAHDPGDIARQLARVLTDAALAATLRARGLAQAARFSWDASALAAFGAIEALRTRPPRPRLRVDRPARPRIAVFSPWRPKETGVADHSARLVEALSDRYEIDLYHEPGYEPAPALASPRFRAFEAARFDPARGYRAILYQMAATYHHAFMLPPLLAHPGLVTLHDFSLAGLHMAIARERGDVVSHLAGEVAYHDRTAGPVDAERIARWCAEPGGFEAAMSRRGLHLNRRVFNRARAVVLPSRWALTQAEAMGPSCASKCVVIPPAIAVAPTDRAATRRRFGIAADAMVVGAFGSLSSAKMNVEAVEAFAALARERRDLTLLFVGQDHEGGRARQRARELRVDDRTRFVGPAGATDYAALMDATDVGLALRRPPTRGESSAVLLELLARGVATLVIATGPFGDLPDEVVRKVDGPAGLVDGLRELTASQSRRDGLAAAAGRHVAREHDWRSVAAAYEAMIERLGAPDPGAVASRGVGLTDPARGV